MPAVDQSSSTVLGWVFPYLIRLVESRVGDAAAIRSLPGFSTLDDPDARVPEASAEAAWRLAAESTRDEAIGVHVAAGLPRGAFDLVEYALRASASLALGLQRLARYGRVLSDRVAVRTESSSHGLLLLVRDVGTSPLHPARAEFALAVALKLARDATGVDLVPLRVYFAHAAPEDMIEHRRFFHEGVRFNAGSNSMVLSAADAGRPLRGADPALLEIVGRRLEKVLASLDRSAPSGPVAARVRRLLVESIGQKKLTAADVARALGISSRTLSRRLGEEKAPFDRILDEVRAGFASAMLRDRCLSVADIAFFLHYSEPAAFHRSFKRWTGQTPQAYRLDHG